MRKSDFNFKFGPLLMLFSLIMGVTNIATAQSDCQAEWNRFLLERESQRNSVIMKCTDTVAAIRFLLKFEGDTKINYAFWGLTDFLPMYKSDKDISNMEISQDRISIQNLAVTNQVAALYLISALYYDNYKFCSRVALYDKKNKKVITNLEYVYKGEATEYHKIIDGKVIKKSYRKTKKWLKLVEQKGLFYVRKKGIAPPLNGLTWYNG